MAVRVVTDSTSDLPASLAQEMGVEVVPLQVRFGDNVYRDGIDLTPREFFQRLGHSPVLPTTSQPSVGEFAQVYRRLTETGDDILSVHISAKLSGTYNAALLAKEEVGANAKIKVLDSLQASFALGLVALAAARAARAGATLGGVAHAAKQSMARTYLFGLLDTLEYLHKGGRIGKAQALLGSLLRVKPILTVREGEAYALARVRTRAKALDHLVELVASLQPIAEMAVVHSSSQEEADALTERLAAFFPAERIEHTMFGPVMGTYIGPNALGVAVQVAEK